MRITTGLPLDDLNKVADAAKTLEKQGYHGVATQENRQDPFLPLAIAATNTETMQLATSITIAFARSPMVFANIAWDLQRASKGRFVLGLGSQVKGHIERRFSSTWTAPAPRMRELVQALRAIFACWHEGKPLNFRGEHYQMNLMPPNFVPEPLTGRTPPITIAAVGPGMLKVAARYCDGVRLHPFTTRRYLEEVSLARINECLPAAMARSNFEVSGGGFVATGDDNAQVAKAFEWVRMRIGFYGSTRAYWPVFAQHGLEALGEELNYLSKNDGWDKMTKLIDDDVVHLFAAVGRFDELESALRDQFGGLVDTLSIGTPVDKPGGIPSDLLKDLARIETPFTAFQS
ncbi:MAG: TIGR03617 family F420-dependent LLM class oxidoreductase [Pseudomonadaceae bacterium]|nr:TIGR03617 family F420-dependent LLM class oxidoreductase [Pseudomonadaceae bacterium]